MSDLRIKDLFEGWVSAQSQEKCAVLINLIREKNELDFIEDEELKKRSKLLSHRFQKKWVQCNYKKPRLYEKYGAWLNKTFITYYENEPSTSGAAPKRKKDFDLCSERTKKRRIADLLENHSFNEIQYVSKVARRRTQSETNPTNGKCLTTLQALALYFDLDLSEHKYNVLRKVVNEVHSNCFPSLYALRKQKTDLLPYIAVTETSAEVDLGTLMQATTNSILSICDIQEPPKNLRLICKWGMDGSSGHSRYKQVFENVESSDEFLFTAAFVPLRLFDGDKNLWENKKPSSTLYCRPIEFVFAKESAAIINETYSEINKKIDEMETSLQLQLSREAVPIEYVMHCTMIDGAVSKVLTNTTSAARCVICNAAPTEMNREFIGKAPCIENYKYGLSVLHCWIRFMECMLHVSYRLPNMKVWQVRQDQRIQYNANKDRIQRLFKSRLGLLIDCVKNGYGTTNDGNTARRFFSNIAEVAEITNLDKNILNNFAIILRVISAGEKINVTTFKNLLTRTRTMYNETYGWYCMPSTVHKVLVHGAEIIDSFDVPIGCLSEEALEARHKEIRKKRLNSTRKNSRVNTNKDLMVSVILSSDPTISNIRNLIRTPYVKDITDIKQYLNISKDEEDNLSLISCSSSSSDDE